MTSIIFVNQEAKGAELVAEFPIGTPVLHEDMANYREGYVCGFKLSDSWGDQVGIVSVDGDSVGYTYPTVARR